MKDLISDEFFILIILVSIIAICTIMLMHISKVEKLCKNNDSNNFMCKSIQEVYK